MMPKESGLGHVRGRPQRASVSRVAQLSLDDACDREQSSTFAPCIITLSENLSLSSVFTAASGATSVVSLTGFLAGSLACFSAVAARASTERWGQLDARKSCGIEGKRLLAGALRYLHGVPCGSAVLIVPSMVTFVSKQVARWSSRS